DRRRTASDVTVDLDARSDDREGVALVVRLIDAIVAAKNETHGCYPVEFQRRVELRFHGGSTDAKPPHGNKGPTLQYAGGVIDLAAKVPEPLRARITDRVALRAAAIDPHDRA